MTCSLRSPWPTTVVWGDSDAPDVGRNNGKGPSALALGVAPAICWHLEVSVPTYQRWRTQYNAMRPEDVVRLKGLEKENARRKRLLAASGDNGHPLASTPAMVGP